MVDLLNERCEGKKVLLLGFGKEGQSSYRVLRKLLPEQPLTIADRDPEVANHPCAAGDPKVLFRCGDHYLDGLNTFEVILKSPGISFKDLSDPPDKQKITSQTDLFLQAYSPRITGITGTKGKSTTSSLIAHILQTAGTDAILLGNIGTPAFHFLDRIGPETRIVDELSSHQLEYIHRGPHIALLLNLYQEHLDAYPSFLAYRLAKLNIARFQEAGDVLVYNADDPLLREHLAEMNLPQMLVPFSLAGSFETGGFREENELVIRMPGKEELRFRGIHNRYLRGEHNLRNILAAVCATALLGVDQEAIYEGLSSFKGLAHRMEYLGVFHGIAFYNDSIATIPEACMAAVNALPDVSTLILGGFDRGIDYAPLAAFLARSAVQNIILVGAAGRRIGTGIEKTIKSGKQLFYINRFDDFLPLVLKHATPGTTCLLSPAAASYDEFRSFEERGFRYRELVTGL
ncbi:MAG: UDP-N-acetylmuramoyl-L-alanine--D-glutamate ligase [bacterium]